MSQMIPEVWSRVTTNALDAHITFASSIVGDPPPVRPLRPRWRLWRWLAYRREMAKWRDELAVWEARQPKTIHIPRFS